MSFVFQVIVSGVFLNAFAVAWGMAARPPRLQEQKHFGSDLPSPLGKRRGLIIKKCARFSHYYLSNFYCDQKILPCPVTLFWNGQVCTNENGSITTIALAY